MLGVLLLTSFLLVIILIAILLLAFNVKSWGERKEILYEKRFLELSNRITETQNLFKKEVTEILNQFKKLLNN